MANKGMTFNSDKAKSKWAALEDKAGTSIEKIVAGTASSSDIKALSSSLSQLSNVASQVFEEAVEAAAAFDETLKNSIASGQAQPLGKEESVQVAWNEGAKAILQEAVNQIKDILELDLLEQTEELTTTIGTKFADLALMLPPKDLPTVNDLLASNELLVEELEGGTKSKDIWDARADGLLDRIYSMFNEKFEEHTKTLADQGVQLTAAERASGVVLAGGTPAETGTIESSASPIPSVNMGNPDLTVNPASSAGGIDSDLIARIEAALASRDSDDKEDKTEKESKKADTWWKSFKEWVTHPLSTTKKKTDSFLDDHPFLKALGAGLLSMILAPEMWKTLVSKFEEYVTWDNIKSTAMAAWDTVTDLADKYLSWDNIKKVSSTVWDWIKTLGSDIYNWIQGAIHGKSPVVNAVKDAVKNDLTKPAASSHSQGVGPVNVGYEAGDASRTWMINKYHQAANAVSNWWNRDSSTSSSPTVTMNRTANLSQQVGAITAQQTSIRQGNTTVTPGTTTAGAVQNTVQTGSSGSTPAAAGTPTISMNTFGFHSGTNDQLMLMNVPGFMG